MEDHHCAFGEPKLYLRFWVGASPQRKIREKAWGHYLLGAGLRRRTSRRPFRSLRRKFIMVAAVLANFIANEMCDRLSLCLFSLKSQWMSGGLAPFSRSSLSWPFLNLKRHGNRWYATYCYSVAPSGFRSWYDSCTLKTCNSALQSRYSSYLNWLRMCDVMGPNKLLLGPLLWTNIHVARFCYEDSTVPKSGVEFKLFKVTDIENLNVLYASTEVCR